MTGRGPYPDANKNFHLRLHFRMKIVEKGKNMQVHADFLMLLDTLRISVIMLIAIIHLTVFQ